MRHVVVHYHLFKNAGSTVDSILQRHFGDRWCSIEGANPWDTLTPDALADLVAARPDVRAISSHQARLPLPRVDGVAFHPILFLRHPIDRVGSVYEFERRQPPEHAGPGARVARVSDFARYVRWRLEPGNGAVFRDFHTLHLSGRERDMRVARSTPADLDAAIARLDALPAFGIVEHFDASLARIRAMLLPVAGDIGDAYSVRNRSEGRPGSLDDRLRDIEDRLGAELHARLLDENRRDMTLYEHACARFDHAIADGQ